MPSVPLPFVVALLLLIFLVRLLRREEGLANVPFLAMIAASALQSILHGLRWSYGVESFRMLQPLLAALIPPLAWLGFNGFRTALAQSSPLRGPWPHALGPAGIALLWAVKPALIDVALPLLYLGYGAALLALGRSGPDALDRVKLDGTISLYRGLQITGIALIISAGIDTAIAFDFVRAGGVHAAWISGLGSLGFIAFLGFMAALAGGSPPVIDEDEAKPDMGPPEIAADDAELMAQIEEMMRSKMPHHDPELTLARLARKMALPARRISAAINRVRALNVSQYVNEHRIADACQRLSHTDMPITQILLEVGFLTKSNFNREFRRVTGMNPSAWRAERKPAAARSLA
jgi:AraC-like DNA-binding protein